ncbi:MAG: hypothetical protein ACKVOE_02515 [Rickettsiales bacterium]
MRPPSKDPDFVSFSQAAGNPTSRWAMRIRRAIMDGLAEHGHTQMTPNESYTRNYGAFTLRVRTGAEHSHHGTVMLHIARESLPEFDRWMDAEKSDVLAQSPHHGGRHRERPSGFGR